MANINPDYYENLKKLVPTDQHVIGVKIPNIRESVKELLKENKFSYTEVLSIVDTLFKNDVREEILFGLFLLEKYKKSFDETFIIHVDQWINTFQNWEICDQLAKLFGMYFAKNINFRITSDVQNKLSKKLERSQADIGGCSLFDLVYSWTNSKHFWRRRFILASSVHLNQKGASNVEIALQLIRPLMFDEHPMVTKGLSWSLRECCKHNKTLVFHFLLEFKGKASKKVIWEASKKLDESLRKELI